MKKIVVNQVHGGFGLSPLAETMYYKLKGEPCYFYEISKYGNSYDDCEYKRVEMKDAEFHRYTLKKDLGENHFGRIPNDAFYVGDPDRDDPDLIKVVEELGEEANDSYSKLVIVEIPDGVDWEIDEYDGYETIHEKHRSWG